MKRYKIKIKGKTYYAKPRFFVISALAIIIALALAVALSYGIVYKIAEMYCYEVENCQTWR